MSRCLLDNVALSDITETLVFTDPYFAAPLNRHTSPQLDVDTSRPWRADVDPRRSPRNSSNLKFLIAAQALVHGDLHTGSIMCPSTRRGSSIRNSPPSARSASMSAR